MYLKTTRICNSPHFRQQCVGLGCVIFCVGAKAASCITLHHYVTRGIVCSVRGPP